MPRIDDPTLKRLAEIQSDPLVRDLALDLRDARKAMFALGAELRAVRGHLINFTLDYEHEVSAGVRDALDDLSDRLAELDRAHFSHMATEQDHA